MAISARNQLDATVSNIKTGAVNDEIELTLAGGEKLVAVITSSSTERMGLSVGKATVAIFKAPSVILSTNDDLILSARNQLAATVVSITHSAVNSEVVVKTTAGTEIVAIVTTDSAKRLELQPNAAVNVLIKASHILLGVRK